MSSIHFFQRYSHPENVATNNTLLLLSRLYHHSSNYFKVFLNDLLDDTGLEAGVLFNQQLRGNSSVPDGNISQASFKLVIETKLHNDFSVEQLESHLKSFGQEERKILLSLSPKMPSASRLNEIKSKVNEYNNNNKTSVKYIPTTFQLIVDKFRNTLEEYDYDLIPIVDDYEEYCINDNLITDDEYRMRAVTCGWTLAENFKYNLYYNKEGYSDHAYIGIYSEKSIRGIGKLSNIISADFENGKLIINHSTSEVTEIQKKNIIDVIPAAMSNNGWDISKGNNFFCVDKFYKTDFRKATKYPLQGTKFFNLKTVLKLEALPETEQIALLLKNITW